MRFLIVGVIFFGFQSKGFAHDTLKIRKFSTHAALISSGGGSLIALQSVWYKPYQTVGFHWFNDGSNWMQMDKFGHGFTAYSMSKSINSAHRWASGKQQLWVGPTYAFTYLLTLEIMDGYSSGWGFSIPDVLANSLGASFFMVQEALWKRQVIQPKFSFCKSPYAALRPNILGSSFPQQLLKDYNGQTYWFSIPLRSLVKLPNYLDFVCVSLGYGCDAKLVGDQDAWQGFVARRQYYFSLDIDCSNLFPKRPILNKVFSSINYLKFPFPSLEFSSNKTRFHWIGF